MRSLYARSFLLAFEVGLGLCFGCASRQRDPQMSGPVSLVRFSDPWVKLKDGHWWGVNDNIQFVIRTTSKSPDGVQLLFAVKQGFDGTLFGQEVYDFPVKFPNYDYYSDTLYGVSLNGSVVRKATPEEWEAADKPLHSYHFIQSFQNPEVTADGVKYKNRLYRRSGATWGNEAALVSPRGTWIAVFSYTSQDKPARSLIPGFDSTEPGRGEVFLDVYRTSSGEQVINARSPYGKRPV